VAYSARSAGTPTRSQAITGALADTHAAQSRCRHLWLHRLEFAGRLIAAADRLAQTAERRGEATGTGN